MCLYVDICVCVSMWTYVYVSLCGDMCMCPYVEIYVHVSHVEIYVYVSLCGYVRMSAGAFKADVSGSLELELLMVMSCLV